MTTNRSEIVQLCLELGMCYEDYPFNDINWTVMRHNGTRKCFAYIYCRNGKLCLNVKATPQMCALYRETYPYVTVGYHMNKLHWVTVDLQSAQAEVVAQLIADSYRLTD